MKARFAVLTDLHADFMHDAPWRMAVFMEEARRHKVDFAIQLGDFCQPVPGNEEAKEAVLAAVRNAPFPFYHTLGNHDMDAASKEEVLALLGVPSATYSFDCGGLHMVVLDACHYRDGNETRPYCRGDYKKASDDAVSLLPDETLAWLKNDLQNAKAPTVLFSHQSLVESRASIANADALRGILREAPHGVLLCICGHEHVDRAEQKEGIYYLCLNGMSYYWAGRPYSHTTYGEELERAYRYLPMIFPYRDPLFAIVDVNDEAITIHGRRSEIVGASPEELHFTRPGLTDPITAIVSDRVLPLAPHK